MTWNDERTDKIGKEIGSLELRIGYVDIVIIYFAVLKNQSTNSCPSIDEDFCSRLRHAKKITTGICIISRGLFFEHNIEIVQDYLWMDTNSDFR